jgi:hypothetical protein
MAVKKYAPPTTEDLTLDVRKVGSGLGFYLDARKLGKLDIELGDKFALEFKLVKGVKTIILREVEK